MSDAGEVLRRWSNRLGLQTTPLFGSLEGRDPTVEHAVMLDGGNGSFALTVAEEGAPPINRSLTWSADLPHHVTVAGAGATVTRWDASEILPLRTQQVEDRLEEFYEYLLRDRVKNRQSVVDHTVTMFRRLRGLLDLRNLPQSVAVDLFLLELSALALPEDNIDRVIEEPSRLLPQISAEAMVVVAQLGRDLMDVGRDFASLYARSGSELCFLPDLAVRHAGGAIFQEAHFDLVRGGQGDFFSGAAPVDVQKTRGWVHFTSPALARIVAEQTLNAAAELGDTVTIFDPACGSAAFLYEAIRILGRNEYRGHVSVFGRDVSPYAIPMARFMLDRAKRDWPSLILEIDLKQSDSLDENEPWHAADVVLMNPPFTAWGNMTPRQREQTVATLGHFSGGKPDYCMAFIEKALTSGKPGVAVGSLLPASVLSLEGSAAWRKSLAERAEVPLICGFGDYGLFRYALIQVGAIVLRGRQPTQSIGTGGTTRLVWTAETAEATGNALRALRRAGERAVAEEDHGWSIDVLSSSTLPEAGWRPRPRRLRLVLEQVRETIPKTVGDLFSVVEGIRSGAREVFTVSKAGLLALPVKEQAYFKPVAEGRNIRAGRIVEGVYLFFPTATEVAPIESEEDLSIRVPVYYSRALMPARADLLKRPAVRDKRTAKGEIPWWELNRPRGEFEQGSNPKIVSAYFGQRGSFAFDESGEFVVLQGHAWLPSSASRRSRARDTRSRYNWSTALQRAWVALLNSRPFDALLAEFCPRVQGGQLNFSLRFVRHIPVPDLPSLASQGGNADRLLEHIAHIQPSQFTDGKAEVQIDEVVAQFYGVPLTEWPLA
jgi:adenine-specific DNA-methyltransferase